MKVYIIEYEEVWGRNIHVCATKEAAKKKFTEELLKLDDEDDADFMGPVFRGEYEVQE